MRSSLISIIFCTLSINAVLCQYVEEAPTLSTTSLVRVHENSSAHFECLDTDSSTLEVVWTSDLGGVLPTLESSHKGNVYTIPSAKREHMLTTYKCTAKTTTGSGTKAVKKVKLEVNFPPEVYMIKPQVHEAVDYPVHFYCFVLGFPFPQVTLTKDGVPVNSDDNIMKVKEERLGAYYTTVNVDISKMQDQHYGEYKCTAQNEFGTASAVSHVIKAEKHECPPVCSDPPVILNFSAPIPPPS